MARVGLSGVVALSDEERLMLEVSAAGGVHFFRLSGPAEFRIARALGRRGLGEVDGKEFRATSLGVDAITPPDGSGASRQARGRIDLPEADLPY